MALPVGWCYTVIHKQLTQSLPDVWEHLDVNYVLGDPKIVVLKLRGVCGERKCDEIGAFITADKNCCPVLEITG